MENSLAPGRVSGGRAKCLSICGELTVSEAPCKATQTVPTFLQTPPKPGMEYVVWCVDSLDATGCWPNSRNSMAMRNLPHIGACSVDIKTEISQEITQPNCQRPLTFAAVARTEFMLRVS